MSYPELEADRIHVDARGVEYKLYCADGAEPEWSVSHIPEVAWVDIPETIDGYKVTTVDRKAAYDNHVLTEVYLPQTVTCICEQAFAYCYSLSTVVHSYNMQVIGDRAFICTKIVQMDLPQCKRIGDGAFCKSGLISLKLRVPCTIDRHAFWGSSIACLQVPDDSAVNDNILGQCYSLQMVDIGKGVQMSDKALADLDWVTVVAPAGTDLVAAGLTDNNIVARYDPRG